MLGALQQTGEILYAASLADLERVIQKFPNTSKGVLVEEVVEGSPAERGGICSDDVIVRCGNNDVRSFLEFSGMLLEKTGEYVELAVLREESGQRLNITLKASERSPDDFYKWPLPEKHKVMVDSVRRW